MEKLKAFYNEHKTVVIGSSIVVGTAAAVLAARTINGKKLVSADIWLRDDKGAAAIVVTTRNGRTHTFTRYLEEVSNA